MHPPSRLRLGHPAPFLLLALACTYEAPLNPNAAVPANAITGQVVVSDLDVTEPVILFLADAADPMPPLGTGRPVTFATVPGGAFSRPVAGVRSAPFSIPGVPDGTWLLTGFMDLDRDFHPSVPTLAGATCGDRPGAWLGSTSSPAPAVLEIGGGTLLADIPVLLSTGLPFERPAFTLLSPLLPPPSPAPTVSLSNPLTWRFSLTAVSITASYGDDLSLALAGPVDPLSPEPCRTALWRHFRDRDADGTIDPHPDYPPELGLLDVWPRIYLEWLGAAVDADGLEVSDPEILPTAFDRSAIPEGHRVVSQGLPYSPCPPLTPDCVPPEAVVIGSPWPVAELPVLFTGQALQIDGDGGQSPLVEPSLLPRGAWSVTVVLETGQTWTVPNELDTRLPPLVAIPPPGVTSEADTTQGTWLSTTD